MVWKMPSKLKVEDLKAHQDLNLKASVDIFLSFGSKYYKVIRKKLIFYSLVRIYHKNCSKTE